MSSKPLLKIMMLGDSGVGKSSVAMRYAEKRFLPQYNATIRTNFFMKAAAVDGSALQIWDNSGTEQAPSEQRKQMYQNSDGAVLVCDCTDRGTLDHLAAWRNTFLDLLGILDASARNAYPFVLLVNKSDLKDSAQFTLEDAQQLSRSIGNFPCFEVSAKADSSIDVAWQTIGRAALKRASGGAVVSAPAPAPARAAAPSNVVTVSLAGDSPAPRAQQQSSDSVRSQNEAASGCCVIV